MPSSHEEEPKIIVDSDWKNQAQAERDRLAEAEAKAEAERAASGGAAPGDIPPPDFQGLVGMLATQAIMYLGGMADRRTGAAIVDLDLSRHFIDLLGVLQDKTAGNLTADEQQDLESVLNELRLRYVEISRAVAASIAKQKSGQVPGDTGGIVMPG